MYFSKEQIAQSIERLGDVNPFFGTVFLAFKQIDLPTGDTKSITFTNTIDSLLRTYYLYYPPDQASENRRIYTPFLTSNTKNRWNKEPYASSLRRIASETFSDAFIRISRPGNQWGWEPNYVQYLLDRHLLNGSIPLFDLAVWLFRTRKWPEDIRSINIIETFLEKFRITEEEQRLFDFQASLPIHSWLQTSPLSYQALINIVGSPPNMVAEGGATLEQLNLVEVGPTKKLEYSFTPRLNLITGDNGLGKTFLLECAWWALTGTWAKAEYPAYPRRDVPKNAPNIAFKIGNDIEADNLQTVQYDWDRQEWATPSRRDVLPGLSIFAQADGSFVVWDPAKHLLLENKRGNETNEAALIRFSRAQIWDGLQEVIANRTVFLCNGLVRDWHTWQTSEPERFAEFCAALKTLSPEEHLIPGEPTRLPPDSRPMPTLKFSYGEVPIVLCSAGIQRVLTLAYLLLWAWHEHRETSQNLRKEPERSIVFLVDEMEAHLHPFWQRVIVPALLDVVGSLSHEVQTQLIVATHSPLVLASVEDRFDRHTDSLFHLYLKNGEVKLDNIPFVKRGRIDLWLMSDLFGLKQPRSKIAEDIIEEAKLLQQTREASKEKVLEVNEKLTKVLAQDDEFWPRWVYFAHSSI